MGEWTRRALQQVGLSLLAAGATLAGLSCGGADIQAPTTGSIKITTATSGPEPDADGYAVVIDDGAGTDIAINGTLQRDNVQAGDHSVRLTSVASTCVVEGENPRPVTVEAGATAAVAFAVTCPTPPPTTGSITVPTTTSGASPDPDGYTVSLDGGMAQAIGVSTSLTITPIAVGQHEMTLADVASNCGVDGDNPVSVIVTPGATVTVTFGVNCAALPSPMIAFVSIGDGSDIFVVNPDGTGLTNLTHSSALEFEPEWSPDRKKIAFASDGDVYGMNADGTGRENLTKSRRGDIRLIRWSPDGSMIAFETYCCSDSDTDEFNTWVMRADGSAQTLLAADAIDFTWSPDGGKIAFVSTLDASGISIINADGTGQRPLVPDAGSPAWSPDGSGIAFVSSAAAIETIHPDGTGRVDLTGGRGHDRNPVWSPDGSRLAFEADWDSRADIGVMKPDGSGRTNLTNNAAPEGRPTWAPDGGKIAFVRYDWVQTEAEVYVVNADGIGEIDVSNSPTTFDDDPAWASR